ncbi:MAG: LLM class flavin-dependent oxidoreductase [Campylobacterales bacterium]|nr:LLM class flavin-dependent oxidoreductase [Campylobacterales bacterium]
MRSFGLFCLSEHFGGDIAQSLLEQLELVALADELGFEGAWFGEHHFNSFSVIPDPVSMMAYAAARTQNIRLGTAGFLASFYHPVRLAESIAVLDNLSGGRIDAGFAKGGFAPDTRHFVCNKEELRSVMFESVEAIDRLLHVRGNDYQGCFVQINQCMLTPPPLQREVPFYIATFASEETIHFAATHGYGLLMSQGASIEECAQAKKFYRMIAGHDPKMVVMRVFYVADTTQEAQYAALPAIDHFVKCMRAAQAEQKQPTFDVQAYEALLRERNAFFDGQKFFDNAIMGSEARCIEQIEQIYKALGDVQIALKPASTDHTTNMAMLRRFATQIYPKLSGVLYESH